MGNKLAIGYCNYFATGEGCHVIVEAACNMTRDQMFARFERKHGDFYARGFTFFEYSEAPQEVKGLIPQAFIQEFEGLPDANCGGLKLSLRFDWNLS
jgi:hypothetical protein